MLEAILGQWVWEWAREWAWWAATSKWVWWRRHKWRLRLTPTVNGVTVPEVGLATDCSKNKEKRGTGTLTLSIFRSPSESTQSSKFDPVRRPGLKSTRQPTNSEASYPVPHQWKVHICRPYSLTIILFGIRATSKNVTSSFCDKTVTPSFVTILVTANFEFWNLNESVIQPCVRKLSNLCMLWNLRVTDFKLRTKIYYCDNFLKTVIFGYNFIVMSVLHSNDFQIWKIET